MRGNLCTCLPDHMCIAAQPEDAKLCKRKEFDLRGGGGGDGVGSVAGKILASAYAQAHCKTCRCAPNPAADRQAVKAFLKQRRAAKRLRKHPTEGVVAPHPPKTAPAQVGVEASIVVLVSPGIVDPERYSERANTILDTWGSSPEIILRFTRGPPHNARGGAGHADHADSGAHTASFPWGKVVNKGTEKSGESAVDIVAALKTVLSRFPRAEWFVLALDISFLIPRNLRALLDNAGGGDTFRWFGKRLGMPKSDDGVPFSSSGSGTVYSRTAANELVGTWASRCSTAVWMSEWYEHNPDVAHAKCLVGNGRAPEAMRTVAGEEQFGVYVEIRK